MSDIGRTLRDAFDSDSVPEKNIALRKAADTIASLRAALEKCGEAQANLVIQGNMDREARKRAEEALWLILPLVAKFTASVGHYNRTPPIYSGSSINHDPDPGYHPALSVSVHGRCPPNSATVNDLRMLAEAVTIARAALEGEG